MLRARLATAGVAVPVLLALILYAPLWLFAGVVAAIAIAGVAEFAAMAFPHRRGEFGLTLALGSLLIIGASCGVNGPGVGLAAALTGSIVAGLAWVLITRPDFERGLLDLGIILVGVLYLALLPHFIWLRSIEPNGPSWVIFTLLVIMIGDTGGYFVGHAWGRHKLMPRVSPGKTIEGSIGILGASLAAGAVAKLLFLSDRSWLELLVLAAAMSSVGQLGDLCESVLKRIFDVKESGWLFPGHGGVLDRVDSLLFSVALLYYHLYLTR